MPKNAAPPEEVLAALQAGATKRTRNSLDIIHTICTEQSQAGNRDFSVATVGRLSSGRGGPSTQAIRNKTGEHYRTLVQAWASQADGGKRKASARPTAGIETDLLEMIDDPCVRAIVGSFLAENRQLKKENVVLKMNANIVIDRRPVAETTGNASNPQFLPPLSTLLPLEVDALRHAVSDELLNNMGWTIDPKTGRVSRGERAIFRAGFATAIKKILDSLKQ
jgi:hypothetical protein